MSKVYDISKGKNSSYLLSQTPNNYSKEDYWVKELQLRSDSEWKYHPNRVLIEYEAEKASNEWTPMEVVVQGIKNDKGEAVSDDYRRLVFRDIRQVMPLGTKWRFSPEYKMELPEDKKDVWLVINKNTISFTSSVVISRCNCLLGSYFSNSQGISEPHYEPAIAVKNLTATSLFYNDVAISPQGALTVVTQYNEYTKKYFINQRFILGNDKVYRIKEISDVVSNTTHDHNNVGTITLYFEYVQTLPQDDFVTRIAYNSDVIVEAEETPSGSYHISLVEPSIIPPELDSEPIIFEAKLFSDAGLEYPTSIKLDCNIDGLDPSKLATYVDVNDLGDNKYSISRNRMYSKSLNLKFYVDAETSPSGEEISYQISLSLRGL